MADNPFTSISSAPKERSSPAKLPWCLSPAVMGEIGIAPRHAPLLTTLKAGEVRVQTPDGEEQFFFVSVRRARDPAEPGDGAGRYGAAGEGHRRGRRDAGQAARGRSPQGPQGDKIEQAEAQVELARAVAQLKALEKLRKPR
jgi:F-type H+-transporting ATPase subunit epsilon